MNFKATVFTTLFLLMCTSCASTNSIDIKELLTNKSLPDEVVKQNLATLEQLKNLNKNLYQLEKISKNKDLNLSEVFLLNNDVYYIDMGSENKNGILWKIEDNKEKILDFSKILPDQFRDYNFYNIKCLKPTYEKCLVFLTKDGADKQSFVEINFKTKSLVANGFQSQSDEMVDLAWKDENTLYIATNFGPGTMTEDGYHLQVRQWNRGKRLDNSKIVFKCNSDHIGVWIEEYFYNGKYHYVFEDFQSFRGRVNNLLVDDKFVKIDLPESSSVVGVNKNGVYFRNREKYKNLEANSLVVYEPKSKKISNFYVPDSEKIAIAGVDVGNEYLAVNITTNALEGMLFIDNQGKIKELKLDEISVFKALGIANNNNFYFIRENMITSPRLEQTSFKNLNNVKTLYQSPALFDASSMQLKQFWANSSGVKVPYFIVAPKEFFQNEIKKPVETLVYSYGASAKVNSPSYWKREGKLWIEKGRAYVIANVRGGGEFGYQWHLAGRGKNKINSSNDLIAISEDLIKKGITNRKKLYLEGESWGGYLVGLTMNRRPDLFAGAIVSVGDLDIMNTKKSWHEEIGNPDDPKDRQWMEKYSPVHNVPKNSSIYPEAIFFTTLDDPRVSSNESRDMVAQIQKSGHQAHLIELPKGGHGTTSSDQDLNLRYAIIYSYLDNLINRQ